MQGIESTAKQIARWIALGALFLVPLTPLLVSSSFFFPFITGKAFYFRIVVEIAVGGWAVLALLDKAYRPRFSWAGAAVLVFVLWMFVADAFALNATKAFWSNFERMEGWVLLVHLLGFFFAASNILRVEKKWRVWFLTSLGVAVVVSFHAFLQLMGSMPIHQGSTRIDASFGNSAYFAVYLLFNTFLAGWLALTEKRAWLKWLLLAFAVIEATLIFFTETRGTILGLVGALGLAALLTALTAGKRARGYAAGGLIALLVLAGGFYLARDSAFVHSHSALERVASISLAQGETRFTIWGMAWKGFLDRPVTGWGQEGFNYVFNTYYNPSLFHQEAWFDRAHNVFIDWLMAGGLPAFLLYLSLFGSAVWLLWKSSELSRAERIALTAALAGYACHNLFVFDNLYSYVYFFAILALIDSQVSRPIRGLEEATELTSEQGMTFALPVAVVAVAACVWLVNVSGMSAAGKLVRAITPQQSADANIALFKELVAHPTFAQQEVREQIVSFASSVAQSSAATDAQKQEILTLAVTEMRAQVAAYPKDARGHLELAYAYRAAGDAQNALKEIQTAASLSPGKESIWVEAGITQWNLGDMAGARADFDKAYQLGPQFPELAAYAAGGAYASGDTAAGDKLLHDAYGTTVVDNDLLAVAYFRAKLWSRLISLWQLRASGPNAGPNELFGLASAYYVAGRNAEAIAIIRDAMAKYPQTKTAGEAAISQIQSGPAGQ